jgi:hypothetical protein
VLPGASSAYDKAVQSAALSPLRYCWGASLEQAPRAGVIHQSPNVVHHDAHAGQGELENRAGDPLGRILDVDEQVGRLARGQDTARPKPWRR